MTRMRDIIIEVQDLIEQNELSFEEIARMTGAPLRWIYEMSLEMSERENQVLCEYNNS